MESELLSRSSKAVDPLSDVLGLVKPQSFMSGGLSAGGEWSFRFEQDNFFRCFALMSGNCWLIIDGVTDSLPITAGDFFALPGERAFCLTSDLNLHPLDISSVVRAPLNGRVLEWQGGGDCLVFSALFTFEGNQASLLVDVLPPVIHISNERDRVTMRWYLERMMTILREHEPGRVLIGEHLAQMILIEVLRLHLADESTTGVGWLFALADVQLHAALAAMHTSPGYKWTLKELASIAGMSRSNFAERFKARVGTSAIDYLTRWRMLVGADRLATSDESVASVAHSLGYESESAFAFAFKRELGCSPRKYSRGAERTCPPLEAAPIASS